MKLYASAIENFLNCGYQYYLATSGYKPKIGEPVLFGRIVHSIIHNDAVCFVEKNEFIDIDKMDEVCKRIILIEIEKALPDLEGNKNKSLLFLNLYKEVIQVIQTYINHIRDNEWYRPRYTEDVGAKFEYSLKINDDVEIVIPCKLDVITENNTAIEFKSKRKNGRIPAVYNVNTHLQSNIYLMALNKYFNINHEIKIVYLKHNAVRTFSGYLTPDAEEKTKKILMTIANAIQKEVYIPAAQDEMKSYYCNYCGVRDYCEYLLRVDASEQKEEE